jgi:tRNA pseudouridine38-40 synthase
MRTLKITVAYDGASYAGWQRQNDVPTIQGFLEAVFSKIEGSPVMVHGAGRTDAGVHALGQVAHVQLIHSIDTSSLVRALNAKLPSDIRVLRIETVTDDFHARYSASSKVYQYRLNLGPVENPLEHGHVWYVRQALNLGRMQAAGSILLGRHNFAAFQNNPGNTPPASTVRTITELEIKCFEGPDWLGSDAYQIMTVNVVGDGFLRNMVRILVGTLVEVGTGRLEAGEMAAVLSSRRRERAGPTAPPNGLFLVRVNY